MARVRVEAAITGWGLQSALGSDPRVVAAAVDAGQSAVGPSDELAPLPDGRAASVGKLPLRDWLKRRKDGKLLARPSALMLCAAGSALGDFAGDRDAVGLYLGVGQEPPDDGESEAALAASARDGQLDPQLLAGAGRDLYPPLLPLRTLPNMALAHVSIHLDLGGANGAWAGGPEAGFHAVRAALWALAEDRCPVALAGAADSHVDLGNARDLRRRGIDAPPGEGAAVLRLEPIGSPGAIAHVQLVDQLDPEQVVAARDRAEAHRAALGRCGAGDGALAILLAAARCAAGGGPLLLAQGDPAVCVRLRAPTPG